jgi:beta-lactamase class A
MCCPPSRQILLQFYHFGLKKKKKLQQTIPFPKDHVTFQQIFTKKEKEKRINVVKHCSHGQEISNNTCW